VAATLDSHNNIIAPDGTIFSGFEFTYDGLTLTAGTSATTVFTPSQGIADQLYQNLTIHTQAFTGSFVSETNFLNDRKETSQKHIDEVTARAERERARLTQVYSKLAALYAQMENDVMQIQMFSESFYRK
jgi:flagellar capping protein FliD